MNDDHLGLKPVWELVGFFLVLLLIGLVLFRQEVFESMRAGFNPNNRNAKVWLAPGEVKEVGSFTLEPERNDPKFVNVTELQTGSNSPKGMPVSFRLTNRGDSNDYPNIRVLVRRGDGREPRIVYFTAAEYPHSGRFDSVVVKLFVPIEPGEIGLTVEATYEGSHA